MHRTLWYPMAALAAVLFTPSPAIARVYVPAVREMTERRSATERHYLLADGAYRAEVHVQPIHFKAPDGSWQSIDTRLVSSEKYGYAYSNESNTLKSYLPATADGWVRVEAGTSVASFQYMGALGGSSSVVADSVEYSALGSNIAISYTAEPGQLKEIIVLKEPGATPAIRYKLALSGLSARVNPDNSVGLIDSTGHSPMRITAPWIKDAAGKSSSRIKVAVSETTDGLVYSIEPDQEWLTSATFPVIIDPTITTVWTAVNSTDEYQRDCFWTPGINSGSTPPDTGTSLAVGASGVSYGPYRSLLGFSITGLPLDSEIEESTLTLYAKSSSGDPNMQVQIYHINKDLDPNGVSGDYPTPNNIGYDTADYTQLAVLSTYASVTVPLQPNFWGAFKNFDVTGLVQSWADDRSTDLNLMLRDTQEDVEPWQRSSATVFFTAEDSELTLEYSVPGWYTFQGNGRRTGHTQYAISENADLQWFAGLPTPNYILSLPQIEPGVVAVPDSANPSSDYPVLYAAVTDSDDTTVYRILDQGQNKTSCNYVISDFEAIGTPLVLAGTTATVPDRIFVAGKGTGNDAGKAVVYCLSALTTNGTTTWSVSWVRKIDNADTKVSPAYSSQTTTYQVDSPSGPPSSASCTNGVVVLAYNDLTQYYAHPGYVIALSVATGKNVWGLVDTDGDLVSAPISSGPDEGNWNTPGGLPPVGYPPTTYSSPAIFGSVAYINDTSCYNNARNLDDGSWRWENATTSGTAEGTISIYSGYLYHAETNGEIGAMDLGGVFGPYTSLFGSCWTTGGVSTNDAMVLFGNDEGYAFAMNAVYLDVNSSLVLDFAWTNQITTEQIRCSPVIAGAPGSATNRAFVGADDGYVYVLDAATGYLVPGFDGYAMLAGNGYDGNGVPSPLNGPVRAAMAAFKGRLYVLAIHQNQPQPSLYCFH